jgi:acyl carrier protein
MEQKERIKALVFRTIDEVNDQLPKEQRLDKSLDAVLFGRGSRLDSIGLVNLVVETESKLADEFGVAVTIADEKAMSQKHSPFRTVGTLVDYIDSLLQSAAK